ncbi:hypothetical protein EXN66_Car006372 [Channa argus]|uniref:Uncharacterized protein n=1 Tax=Channa argus TaxID=215402 RepID=A0A6G1PKF2_CHAAH|nr:hypothetical protein EXN66_Car006372 [Channa argus]
MRATPPKRDKTEKSVSVFSMRKASTQGDGVRASLQASSCLLRLTSRTSEEALL